MATRLKDTRLLPDPTGQNAPALHEGKIKEGCAEVFLRASPKDSPASSTLSEDSLGARSGADNMVLLENPTRVLTDWDTVSAPTNIFAMDVLSNGVDPEPTLLEIMAAVTNYNSLTTQPPAFR